MTDPLLKKLDLRPFRPLPLLGNGKKQTLGAYFYPNPFFFSAPKQHLLTLPDGDRLALIEDKASHWLPSQRIILLVHGLSGSSNSKYLVRLARKFVHNGYLVIRMNMRGCGVGVGLARHLYHSGRSEDTRAVIEWLAKIYPGSPVTLIGFSLGGNVTLKMAGEDAHTPSGCLDSVVAVSPPIDLEASVKLILKKQNQFFNDYFVKWLKYDVKILHKAFPDLPSTDLDKITSLYDFDDCYTAPRSGFLNANDYYTRSSSYSLIPNITLPTFILCARDDPMVSRIKFASIPKKENFDILFTKQGGHVGWIGRTGEWANYRWMDTAIFKWVNLL